MLGIILTGDFTRLMGTSLVVLAKTNEGSYPIIDMLYEVPRDIIPLGIKQSLTIETAAYLFVIGSYCITVHCSFSLYIIATVLAVKLHALIATFGRS